MANEIELKLSLSPAAQRRFLALPWLAEASSRRESRLVNIYYDTLDLDLHRQAIALRLRKDGRTWLQTVKCGGVSAAGLSSRPEWETPWRGDFDFSPVDAEPVREWLEQPRIRPHLTPAFETNFRRITWVFGADDAPRVRLTLDRGWVEANGRREAISELELELAGTPAKPDLAPLFGLARRIAAAVPVMPATVSKAERGYRLFAGGAGTETTPTSTPTSTSTPAPTHATSPRLDRQLTPRAAFHRIALSCLDQLQSNAAGAMQHDDPEFVHQARIAIRRLRSALELFRPALPAELHATWQPALRQLGQQFGAVRNRDVLLTQVIAPALADLPQDAELAALAALDQSARHARATACAALRNDTASRAIGQFLIEALASLHAPAFDVQRSTRDALHRFSRKRLQRLANQVIRRARRVESHPLDPDRRHALRIALKRLRYAAEFLRDIHAAPLRRIVALQTRLGQLNDLTMAGPLLLQAAGSDDALLAAVARLGEWHRPHYDAQLAGLKKRLRGLRHRLDSKA